MVGDTMDYFTVSVDPKAVRREKEKARALRKTQWWRNKIARGRCHYCQGEVQPKLLTMDHIVPLTRGGRSTKGNVVACCKDCNSKKKYMLPIEWSEYMGRLSGQPGGDREKGPASIDEEGK